MRGRAARLRIKIFLSQIEITIFPRFWIQLNNVWQNIIAAVYVINLSELLNYIFKAPVFRMNIMKKCSEWMIQWLINTSRVSLLDEDAFLNESLEWFND